VSDAYARQWGLVWAPPLGFENTFALVMRADHARELRVAKISDLARHAALRPGFGYEFAERADGFPGLAAAYGLAFEARPAEMDLGLLYPALAQGKVDVVAGNSTDGLIAAMGLAVLEDDRRYFPPYEAAYVVRAATWKNARVRAALEPLSGTITAEAMRRMNAAVDRDGRRPEDVAREFLARGRDR
jgi:glycine betaine/choline ABC-type transport system substrate-binding protein